MDKESLKMYRFLMILVMTSIMGFQSWRILFDNFAVNVAGLDGHHIGIIQSIREIPGFLALLAVFVLMFIKEHKLIALSVVVLGIGIAMTGFLPSFYGVIISTLVMSFGFHYFETINQSLTLQYFDTKTAPVIMGKLRSVASASNIVIGVVVFVLSTFLSYKSIYLLMGIMVVLVALWALTQDPTRKDLPKQHKKMVFKKKYWLFYLLTFLAGARRQIFIAFAVFLLVKKFEFSIQEISVLFFVNNLINYFLSPYIGKAIVKFGERKVLTLEYFSLIFIFMAYAYVQNRWIIAGLYILDHIFFNFAMAIRTYYQKIAEPADIAPGTAVGFTINHIAAVFLPAIGGLLWMVDYKIPFLGGAVLSFFSLCSVQMIRLEK